MNISLMTAPQEEGYWISERTIFACSSCFDTFITFTASQTNIRDKRPFSLQLGAIGVYLHSHKPVAWCNRLRWAQNAQISNWDGTIIFSTCLRISMKITRPVSEALWKCFNFFQINYHSIQLLFSKSTINAK